MNILVVSPIVPSTAGGACSRNYHLLKALASRHSVSLLALGAPAEKGMLLLEGLALPAQVIARPTSAPKRWRQLLDFFARKPYALRRDTLVEMQETIDDLLAADHFDLVLFENVLTADYRLPGRVKVVIDEHNIEYELRMRTFQQESALLRKLYNWSESSRLRPFELDLCGRADLVLVTSDRERLTLQRLLPESIFEVVPNGVDLEVFCRRPDVQEVPGRIIFTGSMDYYPNVQAVVHFAKKCWPIIRARIPDASWQIVGKNPLSEVRELVRLPGVSVTGTVPDVRPYLLEATVVVVPLLIGSGTRLKILEAWAMGKAIVSTSLGCEGLEAIPGEHLIVEEHPEAFAEAVVALMHDPGQRTLLGTAARRLVEAEYSWHRSGTRLLEVIEQVFSSDAELQASKPE